MFSGKGIMEQNRNKPKKIRWNHLLIWALVLIVTASAVGILLRLLPKEEEGVTSLIDETIHIEFETEPQSEWVNVVPKPEIDVQHLTVNEFSRPGIETKEIEYIVIHYLGNPQTTAQENHDYFESLKNDLDGVSMSANYVIGLEGEIIECVPPGEIAYASNQVNDCSISIENCHLEETGRFTVETYETCVHLTAWLVEEYQLEREDIIRHYDVTGKQCPLYYVQNPDKWEAFRDDVMEYIEECRAEYEKQVKESEEAAKKEKEAAKAESETGTEAVETAEITETEAVTEAAKKAAKKAQTEMSENSGAAEKTQTETAESAEKAQDEAADAAEKAQDEAAEAAEKVQNGAAEATEKPQDEAVQAEAED